MPRRARRESATGLYPEVWIGKIFSVKNAKKPGF